MRRCAAGFAIGVLVVAPAVHAASRLDTRSTVLTSRQLEALMARALRAPGDSAAIGAPLGRVIAELQNQGYLDARASAAWVASGAGSASAAGDPVLRLEIHEGPRYRWRAIRVQSAGAEDSAGFGGLGLVPGQWASPRAAGEAVERVVRRAADHGHPYARLGVSAMDWDSSGADLRLSGVLGPAVEISRVRFEGLEVTREALARRGAGRLAGAPYSRAAVDAGRDRLAQLGLFRTVRVEGLEAEVDWSKAQVVYRVEEPRYNAFEGAVGMQGARQTVGLARLELGNLAGTGRSAALRWEARGHGVETFGVRYAEPLLFGAPLRLEGALEQHVEDTLYTRTRWGARLQFALSGQEKLEAGYETDRVVAPHGELEQASLQSTVFALERDTRDQRLTPRSGSRARVSASQTFKGERLRPPGRRTARASAIEAAVEWHRPLGASGIAARSGVALELSGAGRFSSDRVLPLFERYAVGGAASLRGHDEQAFRVDRYGLARLEWRWFPGAGGQRVALFWDHALMGTRVPLPAGGDALRLQQADGIGFGLRLATSGGLVGVDYGLEPGHPPLEGKIHLQLVTTF